MYTVRNSYGSYETVSLKEAYCLWLEYGGEIEENALRDVVEKIPTPVELAYKVVSQVILEAKGAFLCSGFFASKKSAVELAEKLQGNVLEYLRVNDYTVSIRRIS